MLFGTLRQTKRREGIRRINFTRGYYGKQKGWGSYGRISDEAIKADRKGGGRGLEAR